MADGNSIEVEGRVVAVLPGTMFKVQLSNGHVVLAHISGKLRKNFIKIAAGDMVKMEMSPYDLEKFPPRRVKLPPIMMLPSLCNPIEFTNLADSK